MSVNHQYQRTRNGGEKLSLEAESYKEQAGWIAKMSYKGEVIKDKLKVTIIYYMAKKRVDHLNCNKILLDAFEGIIYVNDSQIIESHHYQYFDKKNPRVELLIERV